MLIKASDIRGMKVFTLDTGKEIENVDDVIYDPGANKILALLVDKGGLFSDAKVILMSDIRNIGRDAVIVSSEEIIRKAGDVSDPVTNIVKGDGKSDKKITHILAPDTP